MADFMLHKCCEGDPGDGIFLPVHGDYKIVTRDYFTAFQAVDLAQFCHGCAVLLGYCTQGIACAYAVADRPDSLIIRQLRDALTKYMRH